MKYSVIQLSMFVLVTSGNPYDSLEDIYSSDYENEVSDSLLPPAFTSSALHLTVTEGDTVRLPCTVTRLHGFVLLWKKGSRPLAVGEETLETTGGRYGLELEENGNRLVITQVGKEDEGSYTCQVSAFLPTHLEHSIRIRVPPVLETEPESHLTVEAGKPVVMECRVTTGRVTLLYWRKDGTQVSPSGSLSLDGASSYHSGVYQCVAEDGAGEAAIKEVTLRVLFVPEIEMEETQLVRTDGRREVEVTCKVQAQPTATVSWEKDGIQIRENHGVEIRTTGDLHSLHLVSATETEVWGHYTCIAVNSQGTTRKVAEVSGYPDEARQADTPLSLTPTSIQIQWRTRSQTPVTEFRVQFRAPALGGDWEEVEVGAKRLDGEVWGGRVNLVGLYEGTMYEVRISSRNTEGYSQFSLPSTYLTPEAGAVSPHSQSVPSPPASQSPDCMARLSHYCCCIVLLGVLR